MARAYFYRHIYELENSNYAWALWNTSLQMNIVWT